MVCHVSNTNLDDKIHQFVLVHLLCVEVCDEETDVMAL